MWVAASRRPWDQRFANLPMVAIRVIDTSQAPTVFFRDRIHLGGASGLGLLHVGSRIVDDKQHSNRAAPERLGAEVRTGWRLVGYPENGVPDRELGDDVGMVVRTTYTIDLDRPERALIERYGLTAATEPKAAPQQLPHRPAVPRTRQHSSRRVSARLRSLPKAGARLAPSATFPHCVPSQHASYG